MASAPARPVRWVNVEIQGHEPAAALDGSSYTLIVSVDEERRDMAITAVELDDAHIFDTGAREETLVVSLRGVGFDFRALDRQLVIPRTGESTSPARFDVRAVYGTRSVLLATLEQEGKALQSFFISWGALQKTSAEAKPTAPEILVGGDSASPGPESPESTASIPTAEGSDSDLPSSSDEDQEDDDMDITGGPFRSAPAPTSGGIPGWRLSQSSGQRLPEHAQPWRSLGIIGNSPLETVIPALEDKAFPPTGVVDDPADRGRTLPDIAVGPTPSPATAMGSLSSESPPRFISVRLSPDEHPVEPMKVKEWYTLAFAVEVVNSAAAVSFIQSGLFVGGVDETMLRIVLDTDDFDVDDSVQPLPVPKVGPSVVSATFEISPLKTGRAMINALVYKDALWLQKIKVEFQVGSSPAGVSRLSTQDRLPPLVDTHYLPEQSITIWHDGGPDDPYKCSLAGRVSSVPPIRLALTKGEMGFAIKDARLALLSVVRYKGASGQRYVFQQSINIQPKDQEFALNTLSRAGFLLFSKIFAAHASDERSHERGERLRALLSDPKSSYKIQIVGQDTPVPWALLYVGETLDNPDWKQFIGMRHVMEQMINEARPTQTTINSKPQLAVGLNFHPDLDQTLAATSADDFSIDRQRLWWNNARFHGLIVCAERNTKADVISALAKGTDQILFFYCHGHTDPNGDSRNTYLSLNGKEQITLDDLIAYAPATKKFPAIPLVLLNACESAELSTHFFDGFVPYFLEKGALGVIGTECNTPAVFAVQFARRLLSKLFRGAKLGQAVLELRNFCLDHFGNPLGLLYASYCDANAQIRPPLL